jgi:hypothetical protein
MLRPVRWFVTLAVAMLCIGRVAASEPPLPRPIVTHQRSFAIPFDFDVVRPTGTEPAKVELLVSDDQGANWYTGATVAANASQFEFVAPEEGEYWFRVATVDAQGHVTGNPQYGTQPEMRVIVQPVAAAEQVVAGFPVDRMPADEHARMVNTLSFELDYDLESLGPGESSGETSQIELWWTGDGGLNWKRFGVDDDQQSPMLVTVEREGLYGFWLVVEDARGIRGPTPRPGDLPQTWIGVDTTAPMAEIISVVRRPYQDGQEVLVQWKADDALLAAQPITLFYTGDRSGPWTPLASGLDNSGLYRGATTAEIPAEMYIRLEVRDEAGNVKSVETTTPAVFPASGHVLHAVQASGATWR